MPSVGESIGPSPSTSRLMDARMAAETALTRRAARYGSRFGISPLRMISGALMPDRRATSTQPRSRRLRTWARIVRAGFSHASEATMIAIWSTVSPFLSDTAMMISTSNAGTVRADLYHAPDDRVDRDPIVLGDEA